MSPFLRHFFFLFPFVFLFLSSLSHAFGGDVRPLTLVVIGRGQKTTPYILVIPSEGDYCFLGQLFCFLCSILPLLNDHKHNRALLFELSPSLKLFTRSLCPVFPLFPWLSCLHVCSALSVAGYLSLSVLAFFFFLHATVYLESSLFKIIFHH